MYKVQVFELAIEDVVPWLDDNGIETICIPIEQPYDGYELSFSNEDDCEDFKDFIQTA